MNGTPQKINHNEGIKVEKQKEGYAETLEWKCVMCGKICSGIQFQWDKLKLSDWDYVVCYQCDHCKTNVCSECEKNNLNLIGRIGRETRSCPSCGKSFELKDVLLSITKIPSQVEEELKTAFESGKWDEVVCLCDELLEIHQGDNNYLYHKGLALEALGQRDEASKVYRQMSLKRILSGMGLVFGIFVGIIFLIIILHDVGVRGWLEWVIGIIALIVLWLCFKDMLARWRRLVKKNFGAS